MSHSRLLLSIKTFASKYKNLKSFKHYSSNSLVISKTNLLKTSMDSRGNIVSGKSLQVTVTSKGNKKVTTKLITKIRSVKI